MDTELSFPDHDSACAFFDAHPFTYFLCTATDGVEDRPKLVMWLSDLIAKSAWRGDVHILYVDNLVFMASSDRRDIEDVADILASYKRQGVSLTAAA